MTESEEFQQAIEGHVVVVLDSRELVIDKGSRDGVTVGMRFAVLDQVGVDTPNGGSITIDYPKTIVKIVRLQGDELSVGRTFRTIPGRKGRKPIDILALGSMKPYLEGTPDIPPRTETINTGGENTALKGRDTVVRAGDIARQTVADEFLDTL